MEHQFHQMLMDMQGKFQEALETKVERGLTALEVCVRWLYIRFRSIACAYITAHMRLGASTC
jgi:hypothetical protein